MKILIAGGAGYIGSSLVPRLTERSYTVDVVDLLWFGNKLPGDVNVMRKDVMDVTEEEIAGYDTVIFLAGLSNDPMAEYSPSMNYVSNAAAPAYLAFISKKAGVRRFIYGGSCSVYGYTINELYDEESPTISNYPYGISKLQGEFGCMHLADDSFSVICFRKGTVSGYSPRMRLDLIINTMFKWAMVKGVITVNNPRIWRPIVSVKDVVSAYVRAVETAHEISGVFNISSGNYTVGEVADYVKDGLKKHMDVDVKLNIKYMEDYRNYKVDTEKARKIMNFRAIDDIDDIVKNLVDNYEHFKDIDNDVYYNIRVFNKLQDKN